MWLYLISLLSQENRDREIRVGEPEIQKLEKSGQKVAEF